jgi:lipoprotein NlpI
MAIFIVLVQSLFMPSGFAGFDEPWKKHLVQAQAEEKQGNYLAACRHLDTALAEAPHQPELLSSRGGVHFKLGRLAESLADFDAQIKARPGDAAVHWRRGLTLYYLGKYREGAEQFVTSDRAEPEDVENAVWHLLCLAKVVGVEAARGKLLKVSKDSRVPMGEVYSLFAGRGTAEQVFSAAEIGEATPEDRRTRRFYAHLYTGLFEEMQGRPAKARELIDKAVKDYPIRHYMMDVARVHLQTKQ